jgi:hypothetical protein
MRVGGPSEDGLARLRFDFNTEHSERPENGPGSVLDWRSWIAADFVFPVVC